MSCLCAEYTVHPLKSFHWLPDGQGLQICFQLATSEAISSSVFTYQGGDRAQSSPYQDEDRRPTLRPPVERIITEYNVESTNMVTNDTLFACANYTVDVSTILFDESAIYRVETEQALYGVTCHLTSKRYF